MKQRRRVKRKYVCVWPFPPAEILRKMAAQGTPGPYYWVTQAKESSRFSWGGVKTEKIKGTDAINRVVGAR